MIAAKGGGRGAGLRLLVRRHCSPDLMDLADPTQQPDPREQLDIALTLRLEVAATLLSSTEDPGSTTKEPDVQARASPRGP
ncbi:hypothetical protein [Thiorhodococcus minor]|uniref:Uncharacterized protein n=1 Tax=Thiorhodococcus minor TaxID=57489 RepID=A0A6M0K261_9GAMM|nr:hypothetical protein [Thiorhodococcus minor]NEV63441.1 hypothetical protein [Thiorhodococcus minor]